MYDFYLKEALVGKFFRFIAVGFSGLLVDYGITALSKEIIRLQKYAANALGFIVAATSNYYLNRIWTFHSHNPQLLLEFSQSTVLPKQRQPAL